MLFVKIGINANGDIERILLFCVENKNQTLL